MQDNRPSRRILTREEVLILVGESIQDVKRLLMTPGGPALVDGLALIAATLKAIVNGCPLEHKSWSAGQLGCFCGIVPKAWQQIDQQLSLRFGDSMRLPRDTDPLTVKEVARHIWSRRPQLPRSTTFDALTAEHGSNQTVSPPASEQEEPHPPNPEPSHSGSTADLQEDGTLADFFQKHESSLLDSGPRSESDTPKPAQPILAMESKIVTHILATADSDPASSPTVPVNLTNRPLGAAVTNPALGTTVSPPPLQSPEGSTGVLVGRAEPQHITPLRGGFTHVETGPSPAVITNGVENTSLRRDFPWRDEGWGEKQGKGEGGGVGRHNTNIRFNGERQCPVGPGSHRGMNSAAASSPGAPSVAGAGPRVKRPRTLGAVVVAATQDSPQTLHKNVGGVVVPRMGAWGGRGPAVDEGTIPPMPYSLQKGLHSSQHVAFQNGGCEAAAAAAAAHRVIAVPPGRQGQALLGISTATAAALASPATTETRVTPQQGGLPLSARSHGRGGKERGRGNGVRSGQRWGQGRVLTLAELETLGVAKAHQAMLRATMRSAARRVARVSALGKMPTTALEKGARGGGGLKAGAEAEVEAEVRAEARRRRRAAVRREWQESAAAKMRSLALDRMGVLLHQYQMTMATLDKDFDEVRKMVSGSRE